MAEFAYGLDLRKVRLEKPARNSTRKPQKTFRWEHLESGKWWAGNGGKQKPLYMNSIFREGNQDGIVLGFEGEAKADIAGELGFPAFSYKEFTPAHCQLLSGCDVVFFPDKDASGDRQGARAATILVESKQARSISIITPPEELTGGGDIVDGVRTLGWDRERIAGLIADAQPFATTLLPRRRSARCDMDLNGPWNASMPVASQIGSNSATIFIRNCTYDKVY